MSKGPETNCRSAVAPIPLWLRLWIAQCDDAATPKIEANNHDQLFHPDECSLTLLLITTANNSAANSQTQQRTSIKSGSLVDTTTSSMTHNHDGLTQHVLQIPSSSHSKDTTMKDAAAKRAKEVAADTTNNQIGPTLQTHKQQSRKNM